MLDGVFLEASVEVNKIPLDIQGINRFLVEKFGSLVRLTPNLFNPISSPGVGIWVR